MDDSVEQAEKRARKQLGRRITVLGVGVDDLRQVVVRILRINGTQIWKEVLDIRDQKK
jgi:hypothetical protein